MSKAGRNMNTQLGSNCILMWRQMMSSSIKQSLENSFTRDWHLVSWGNALLSKHFFNARKKLQQIEPAVVLKHPTRIN
jgi:hypothetical protein